jgi:hypothetical protein
VSFRNEPILELRRAARRESLLEALRALDAKLPLAVPARPSASLPGPAGRAPRRPPRR